LEDAQLAEAAGQEDSFVFSGPFAEVDTTVTVTSINGADPSEFAGFDPDALDLLVAEVVYTLDGGAEMRYTATFTETDNDGMRFRAVWTVIWPGTGPQVHWVVTNVETLSGLVMGKYHPATVRVKGLTADQLEDFRVKIGDTELELEDAPEDDCAYPLGGSRQIFPIVENGETNSAILYDSAAGTKTLIDVAEMQAILKKDDEVEGEAKAEIFQLSLLADSNRDGSTNDADGEYKQAPVKVKASHGALVVANTNFDKDASKPDCEGVDFDRTRDYHMVKTKRLGLSKLPAGLQIIMSIEKPDDDDGPAARERAAVYWRSSFENIQRRLILAKTKGESRTFTPGGEYDANRLIERGHFYVEGLDYAREVVLRVRAQLDGQPLSEDYVRILVSPFALASNAGRLERVWVPYPKETSGSEQAKFRKIYDEVCKWCKASQLDCHPYKVIVDGKVEKRVDTWIQDAFECGYSESAVRGMICILETNTSNQGWGKQKAKASGYGYVAPFEGELGQLNQGGNMEVSPPTKLYPYGRLVVGSSGGSSIDEQVLAFFERQRIQLHEQKDGTLKICEKSVAFLSKPHIDAILSFTDEKILIAAPHVAVQCWLGAGGDYAGYMNSTIQDICAELGISLGEIDCPTWKLSQYNNHLWTHHIEPELGAIYTELGMEADDVILVPTLFFPNPANGKASSAPFPNRANLLYVRNEQSEFVIFGDNKTGGPLPTNDPIKAYLSDSERFGTSAKFIISDVLYEGDGDIHCATQAARRGPHPDLDYNK